MIRILRQIFDHAAAICRNPAAVTGFTACNIAQQRAFTGAVDADNTDFIAHFNIKSYIFKQSSDAIAVRQLLYT